MSLTIKSDTSPAASTEEYLVQPLNGTGILRGVVFELVMSCGYIFLSTHG